MIEAVPIRLVEQLRAFFHPRDRDVVPASGRAVVLQAGPTADRPATPTWDGQAYYDTTANVLYIGDGGAWNAV